MRSNLKTAELYKAFTGIETSQVMPINGSFKAYETSLLSAFQPLINAGYARLRHGVQTLAAEYPNLPFNPETALELLARGLPKRLLTLAYRTLILELRISHLEGQLDAESPHERFEQFCHKLRQRDHILELLSRYPVLGWQLNLAIDQWSESQLEFLCRLCIDWKAILETFDPDPGTLSELKGGLGDRHANGRSTMIATFRSGFKLVYKPRSLAIDQHFQALLEWLDARGDQPSFRLLKVLDRQTHGWTEFVYARGCETREELRRFYLRQGAFLALLHGLHATDFHYENLIAAGEHPVLVDLETLFHPMVPGAEESDSSKMDFATPRSVLRIGLLPQRIGLGGQGPGIDLSGLGATDQSAPVPVPDLEHVGTDRMQVSAKQVRLPAGHHRPAFRGEIVPVANYSRELIEGFTDMYRLLRRHRRELLASHGPLEPFSQVETRVLLRPTEVYARLIHASFHPDYLQDLADRSRHFDHLRKPFHRQPDLKRVVLEEVKDLEHCDIPRFTTCPESRDLVSSSGERIAKYFSESGMTQTRRRLEQLDDQDLEWQCWVIGASLETAGGQAGTTPKASAAVRETDPQPFSREALLDAAGEVGQRLLALSVRHGDRVAWLHLDRTVSGDGSVIPVGLDLYKGLPGIILFLGYLGSATGEERYTELARSGASTVLTWAESVPTDALAVGAFEGWGGIIYTLTHLAAICDEPSWLERVDDLALRLKPFAERDEHFDIIGGSAGCVACLTARHRYRPSSRILDLATQLGHHLLQRAVPMETGIAWCCDGAGGVALTGFSHGAAGISWALLGLASISNEKQFREAAQAAIAYERSLFSCEEGNWPDLRPDVAEAPSGNGFSCAWCHGAPGIGLARLASLPWLDDDEIRSEIRAAVETTLAGGFGENHSLCHGDLGNLELMVLAGEVLDDPRLRAASDATAMEILRDIRRGGYRCGLPVRSAQPGLMAGLAGIGYGLLRLAEPRNIPSVLLLEPPLGSRKGVVRPAGHADALSSLDPRRGPRAQRGNP